MSLTEKLQEIKLFDGEILALVKDEDLEEEIAQVDLFKEQIYSTLIKGKCTPMPAAAPTTAAHSWATYN